MLSQFHPFFFLCCAILSASGQESEFKNDIDYVEENTGGRLQIQSNGKLASIIDLDQTSSVRRVLCKGEKILVALNLDQPEPVWKAGQIVIGSEKWKCHNNALRQGSGTIYAKVSSVMKPKKGVVELLTLPAGPLEMFDEADIAVHYEQGQAPVPSQHRHKRYSSNPLHKALQDINWNASVATDIPFNEHGPSKLASKILSVFKLADDPEIYVNQTAYQSTDKTQFLYRCHQCRGRSKISYHFELKVNKVNNKPNIQKYMMQVEIDSEVSQNFTLDSRGEQTLTRTATLWRSTPQPVLKIPVAVFKTFPPIVLSVSYASQANMELKAMTRDVASHSGRVGLAGVTIVTQRFEKGMPAINDAAVYNWTVTDNSQLLSTNNTMNASVAFFQNISISPAISWVQKDVDLNLGQPIQVSIRPTVQMLSSKQGVSRCDSTYVEVETNVSVAETDFSVDAFDIHIWSVKLADPLKKRLGVLEQQLLYRCSAACHGPAQLSHDGSLESACGIETGRIVRGDANFARLHQLWGDYILFGSGENKTSVWCGRPGRKCVSCVHDIAGSTVDEACADRMMASELASSISLLGRFVKAEWPERKLIVLEALDEPTSGFPLGRHGNVSLFNEGRAATVSVSKPSTVGKDFTKETDDAVLRRLGELAVCSGFQLVQPVINNASFEVCVKPATLPSRRKRSLLSRKRRSGELHHPDVKHLLNVVGKSTKPIASVSGSAYGLDIGMTFPRTLKFEEACGGQTDRVSLDQTELFQRLIHYPHDDVEFDPEGLPDTWCGVETRQCGNCSRPYDDDLAPWDWCQTRTMSMRLATRLKRLSVLTNNTVRVHKALNINVPDGMSALYSEGRAANVSLKSGTALDMKNFAELAIRAGFDSVKFTSANYIEVCVKQQDGLETTIVHFPLVNLVSAAIPLGEDGEFGYPHALAHEARKPLLFDGDATPDDISYHFKRHHVESPGVRYFRLDPVLIDLLELVYDDLPSFKIVPGSAYRPRSVNINNVDSRHPKEIHRYQMGQAVEIQPYRDSTDDALFPLALALMRAARSIRTLRLGIGIGAKTDRLYFDVRPLALEDVENYLDVWDSGNTALFNRLKHIQSQVYEGGSIIPAITQDEICRTPELGEEFFYLDFDLDELGNCSEANDEFCSDTQEHRYNTSLVFQHSLTRAAGPGRLPRPDIAPLVQQCVVTLCGGCPSAGEVWKHKVIACTKMIMMYLSRSSMPFQPLLNKVSLFNTENTESSVHSQACHGGRICVENTQIYSLLLPLIMATFKNGKSEELLFGGTDNPTPLLEIVEQELAWRAEGVVHVYIDSDKDISALRKSLKIVMMLNKNVTEVEFHMDPDLDHDDVINTVQQKVEAWSGSTCPKWSRLVVPPYTFSTIPRERKRRSLERSQDRNKLKLNMENWEVDWMLKT